MAQRRMLSRTIIESGESEELTPLSQLLYLRMNLIADDDGFSDCFALSRLLGATPDTFSELVNAGFIRKVDGKKYLYHIRHWRTHNTLERAKYRASEYRDKLSDLYQNEDFYSVLPTWERPVNETIPQYSPSQGNSVQGNSGESKSVQSMSSQDSADHNYDDYFKHQFPVGLKDLLASWAGFKYISVDRLRELIFDDGIDPVVITWAACKAADGAADSRIGYFNAVIQQKCVEEGCKTINDLIDCEDEDRKMIYDIRQEISNLQAQVENAWKERPF